jgi:hypothetical protein
MQLHGAVTASDACANCSNAGKSIFCMVKFSPCPILMG